MSYKWIIANSLVMRVEDGASIPCVDGNADYKRFLDWVALGNTALPQDPATAPIDPNDLNNMPKMFRAKCISDLAFRLGVLPGALTPVQKQDERTRLKSIADSLP